MTTPHLNGGLFLKHQIEERYGSTIAIANTAFAELFAFFDQYQWHLDERPLRADDEINPDVLGYIFEKYINQKQMGAYYTKEDITEYIAKNTIIPYLFDAMQKADSVPFRGEHALWNLLAHDPDRYIYRAVAKGMTWSTDAAGNELALAEPLPLPANIAVGVAAVAQRGDWNTPTPPSHGLPTEIWRETVARRQRYSELKTKLTGGEIRAINDLITLNLDITQFAQDVLDATDSPDLIRAAWQALNRMTVLDPTCGSGAFLFAALNMLEPLYEACLNRMESFVEELHEHARATGIRPHPQKLRDFRDELAAVAQHPNRRYFTLKRIMVNNLYGVDIMEEAVEICKLRLFLKLVAQLESKGQIEPLPDIDFNIRAGNTLVGFATQEEISRALEYDASRQGAGGETQMTMLFGEDQAALAAIKDKADDVDQLFALFRQQQTTLGGEVSAANKADLRRRLGLLADELNRLLARQYGVDPAKLEYETWLESHKPFHWFVEFYGVLQRGGFDVIIGNPPYVELNSLKSYQLTGYKCISAGNLYALAIERGYILCSNRGRQGFIVPVSSISTSRYAELQRLLQSRQLHYASFDDRPSRLFDGLQHIRLTIHVIGSAIDPSRLYSTKYNKWSTVERSTLLQTLCYTNVSKQYVVDGENLPKLTSELESNMLEKLQMQKPLQSFYRKHGAHYVYYSRKVGYFLQVLNFEPKVYDGSGNLRPPSEFKRINLGSSQEANIALCALNSNFFYWYITVFSDCRHVNKREVDSLPLNMTQVATDESAQLFSELAIQLMQRLIDTSEMKQMKFSHDILTIQCIYPKHSKPIIDEIDRVLAQHYGFTAEELDFLLNYDIKYRMGDELFGEGEESEQEDA